MAIETVTFKVGKSWKLLSSAAAGPFEAYVRSGTAQFFMGDTAPAADYDFGLSRPSMSYAALAAKVWARAQGETVSITCMRTVDAGNVAEVMLGAVGLSATSFVANVAAGTEIATITGRVAGDKIEGITPGDGRIVLSADGSKLLRGLTAVSTGKFTISIERSHPDAPNSGRRTEIEVECTAPPIAAITSVTVVPLTNAGTPNAASWATPRIADMFRADVVATGSYDRIAYSWRPVGEASVNQFLRWGSITDAFLGKKPALYVSLLKDNAVVATATAVVAGAVATDNLIVIDGLNDMTGTTIGNATGSVDASARAVKGSGINLLSGGTGSAMTLTKSIGAVDLTQGKIAFHYDTQSDQTAGNVGIAFKPSANNRAATGSFASGSTTVTRTGGAKALKGDTIAASGIPANTTITAVAGNALTISAATTAAGTDAALTLTPTGSYSSRTEGKSQRSLGTQAINGGDWMIIACSDEDASAIPITATGDATIAKDMRLLVTPNAPFVSDVTFDAVLKTPTDTDRLDTGKLILTYDDWHPDLISEVLPYLRDREVPFTAFLPSLKVGGPEDGTGLRNPDWDAVVMLDAAGVCVGTDVTVDDASMLSKASIQAIQDENGVNDANLAKYTSGRGRGFGCAPFGDFRASVAKTTCTVSVTAGSNVVQLTVGNAPAIGNAILIPGVPRGTTVANVSGSDITLSCNPSAVTKTGSFVAAYNDRTSPFYEPKILDALRYNATTNPTGLKVLRLTYANLQLARFGGFDWLMHPGWGMSGASVANGSSEAAKQASRIAALERAAEFGLVKMPYIHSVTGTETGNTINMGIPSHRAYIDRAVQLRDQGKLEILTIDTYYARYANAALRLPAAA